MKRVHLIIGILVFVAFVITGRFMRLDFPDKNAVTPDLRLLMRSRHIYILFSALIHLTFGVYLQIREPFVAKGSPVWWFRSFDIDGSECVMVT